MILLILVVVSEVLIGRRLRVLLREIGLVQSNEHFSTAQITVRGKDEIGQLASGLRYIMSALRVNKFRWLRSEKHLQKVLALTPSGVIFVDRANDTVERINRTALVILGARHRDIVGRPISELIVSVHGTDGEETTLKEITHARHAVTASLRRADGSEIPAVLNARDVHMEDDRKLLLSFVPEDLPTEEWALR